VLGVPLIYLLNLQTTVAEGVETLSLLTLSRLPRGILLLLLLALTGCFGQTRPAPKTQSGNDLEKFDNSLRFSNVTLEQADEQGKLWWKVKAVEAIYNKDKKIAAVEKPEGELYQDGKPIFKVVADKGEVIQDGKSIMLRGKITATDLKDGTILQGQEIEWKPTEDKLFVRKQFVGNHKQMRITGDEGLFLPRKREAEVKGKVIADVIQPDPKGTQPEPKPEPKSTPSSTPTSSTAPTPSASPTPQPLPSLDPNKPRMQMQTTLLKWQIDRQLITADQPLKIDRIINGQVTDRATAETGAYDMKAEIATLKQNAEVILQAQSTQVKSNELVWQTKAQLVQANQPINIMNDVQKITMNADRGNLNVLEQKATLTGHVKGLSLQNQANVSADNLIWFLLNQTFEATGNINYQQINPPFNLMGTKASGMLQTQEVEISGGPESDNRVVTEIVPNLGR
jgi:LPS export ABC transporter protein LptC